MPGDLKICHIFGVIQSSGNLFLADLPNRIIPTTFNTNYKSEHCLQLCYSHMRGVGVTWRTNFWSITFLPIVGWKSGDSRKRSTNSYTNCKWGHDASRVGSSSSGSKSGFSLGGNVRNKLQDIFNFKNIKTFLKTIQIKREHHLNCNQNNESNEWMNCKECRN